MEMSRLTRDGTAEPVSRDQILRHARGQGNIIFPVQLTTSRIGNLTRLIHTLLYVMIIHTYIHTYIHTQKCSGRPGSSEVPRNLMTRWDVSSIPANGIFLTKKIKTKNKNTQRVENDCIVSTQNSTSRSTRERNGGILLARKIKARTAERRWMKNPV